MGCACDATRLICTLLSKVEPTRRCYRTYCVLALGLEMDTELMSLLPFCFALLCFALRSVSFPSLINHLTLSQSSTLLYPHLLTYLLTKLNFPFPTPNPNPRFFPFPFPFPGSPSHKSQIPNPRTEIGTKVKK